MDDLIGKVIDRKYRLVRLLGEGGMGAVYEAEHTKINRKVAVKLMKPEVAKYPEAVERFMREAQAASAIGHPNIIEIEDIGESEDGTVFMVMEMLKGQTLAERLSETTRLPPDRAVGIILQVLSALLATHRKGIIHRDLKPENIYLSIDARMREEVKLLDFGASKVRGPDAGGLRLTRTGTVMGTPYYLSPEQARGSQDITEQVDIWAVGVVLFEMLTGRPPYEGESYNELLSKILMEPVPDIRQIEPAVSAELAAVIGKALAKDRKERYRNAAEVIEALLPFHSAANESMTPSAEHFLRTSVAPPPAGEARAGKRLAKNTTPLRPDAVLKQTPAKPPADRPLVPEKPLETTADIDVSEIEVVKGPTAEAVAALSPDLVETGPSPLSVSVEVPIDLGLFGPSEIAPEEPAPEARPAGRRKLLLMGGAAAVIAVGIVIAIANVGTDKPAQGAKPATPAPIARPIVKSIAPSPLPEPEPRVTAPAAAVPVPDLVTVGLSWLPPRAAVRVNGKLARPPLRMKGSDTPVTIEILASGYVSFKRELVPNKDQIVAVTMEKLGADTKPAPKSAPKAAPKTAPKASPAAAEPKAPAKPPKKKPAAPFAENPFAN
jgi:serine/threonine protein kinase